MSEMVYDFATHGLYYSKLDMIEPNFSLVIDTLELFFDLHTRKLLRIQGYFPLVNAIECDIELPVWEEGDYILQSSELSRCKQNEAYDFFSFVPQVHKYFGKSIKKYDKKKGIIQLGTELQKGESGIKVNDNIFCGLDINLDLKCLYIVPAKFKLWSDAMERNSVYGELLYLGYCFEKGRYPTGRWKRKYKDEVYRHLLFLKKVLELMLEKSAEADEIMLMTFSDFLEKEENIRKYYPLSLKGEEILYKGKNLKFTEEGDLSNKFINSLMYEMTIDCLNELKKTFVNKKKIKMLLRALHNLPRAYLRENVDTLCDINGPQISQCDAIEYSFANMDTETKEHYLELARLKGIIS